MSPRCIRLVAIAVCVSGIAGMIVTSIRNSTSGALAFGIYTVGGALTLLLIGALVPTQRGIDEVAATELETEIADLVADGVDERRLRRVVHLARRLDGPPPVRPRDPSEERSEPPGERSPAATNQRGEERREPPGERSPAATSQRSEG